MRGKKLLATFLLGIGTLGITFFPAKPVLSWSDETWEINGYIGWEFLNMERRVVFSIEFDSEYAYPLIKEQEEYMKKAQDRLLEEVKEHFEDSFTPLVIVAYRESELEDRSFYISDVTCESDSRIYRANRLGRFEYQYVNIPKSVGACAFFEVPSGVTYTCFWLLPTESLTGKVYLRGEIEPEWTDFRIEVGRNELFLGRYIEQLQKTVGELNQRINKLKERSAREN